MKNVSTTKLKNNIESPKTPGGISKSLLTPCRRVGLSRNWRNSGPSPFVSPLCSNNTLDIPKLESESRKRKNRSPEKETENSENGVRNVNSSNTPPSTLSPINESSKTPKRTVLQRKKSKTFLLDDCIGDTNNPNSNTSDHEQIDKVQEITIKKRKSISQFSRQSSIRKDNINTSNKHLDEENCVKNITESDSKTIESKKGKQVSPNNLTKECIVVIQNKINKHIKTNENVEKDTHTESAATQSSQTMFDSDSDDMPLCQLNQNEKKPECLNKKESKETLVTKLHDKKTLTSSINNASKNSKLSTKKPKNTIPETPEPISQSSNFDDDDADEFETKKTILIRKSYDKVSKPLKAKSTGSITEHDIEQIKARIKAKKNLLLARSLNPDTEELRSLIKKWQKGCQDALIELMDLMKKRMPDQNVDNSEILHMLKIPPDLVGYDSDNDCFITPDDANIVLSSLNIP